MLLIDMIIIFAFLICLYIAVCLREHIFLLSACAFAFLFENLHVYAFAGKEGGYYYTTHSLMLLQTPLYIILSWGILLFTSRMLIACITRKKVHFVFLVPLITLLVDLALDPFAIRSGLWVWIGYQFHEGYFGVPAGNFLAWLIIAWSFMLCFTFIEKKWLAFLCSYPLFAFLMNVISFPKFLLNIPQSYELWYMLGIFIIYLAFYRYLFLCWDAEEKPKHISSAKMGTLYALRILYYLFPLILMILFWEQFNVSLLLATMCVYIIELMFGIYLVASVRPFHRLRI